MYPIHLPIYVLLEIVEWEFALQMAEIELDCVKKRYLPMDCHRKRLEQLHRKERVQTIESIYNHNKIKCTGVYVCNTTSRICAARN